MSVLDCRTDDDCASPTRSARTESPLKVRVMDVGVDVGGCLMILEEQGREGRGGM